MHIGRTGRAGRTGDAVSFVTPRERYLLKAIERATRQPLTQMPLPSVEDVNETRVAKFTDSITEALASDKIGFFRDLVADYEQEHDVPASDIAAALAVLAQDGQPLLLEPDPEPPTRVFEGKRDKSGPWDHEKGRRRDDDGRPKRRDAKRRGRSDVPMTTYTIAVGKRHKVEPRQIVGAIANRGWPRPWRLRAHRHPRRPLPGGAAGRAVARDLEGAGEHAHLRQAHRAS